MSTARNILVGIDFSPPSRNALLTALRIAQAEGASVTALHVMDPLLAGEIKTAHEYTDQQLRDFMAGRLAAFLGGESPLPGTLRLEFDTGPAFVTLVQWCNDLQADLLVLGSRGTTHTSHQVGAIASKCARQAPADVLLVREELTRPFRQIVACVDFSETSARSVKAAAALAAADGARLDCLFVNQTALALSLDYAGFVPSVGVPDTTSSVHWKEELDQFLAPLIPASLKPSCRGIVLERVNVRDAIYEHVHHAGADLVVLGTRGRTDLRMMLMGTTAEKVVTHSPCSVLAVKPEGYSFRPE